jgi:glycosyltransferase 2 family protein
LDRTATSLTERDAREQWPARLRHSGLKRALAYAFALACLVWVFHDINPRRLLAAMSIAKWQFIVLAIVVDILTYVLQGLRWKLLLAPVGRLSSLRATQAIYAGLFTNELVPLRFGELVRAFLVSRWLSTRFASVLPSIVVERFLDAVWLAAAIGLAAMLAPLPKEFIQAGYVLSCVVLLAAALLLWLVYREAKGHQGDAQSSSSRLVRGVSRFASQFASGLRNIGKPHRIVLAALLSAGMLICQILALWFILLGCAINLPFRAGMIILLIVRLGTAIPNAPANVGSTQFFSVVALEVFGVEKTVAAGFSITYFLVLTVPLWVIGLFAISNAGSNLSSIRSEVASFDSGHS